MVRGHGDPVELSGSFRPSEKAKPSFKLLTKQIEDMLHISHLSEVALCSNPRPFKPSFNVIYWPGSRKARSALERAVGWLHLEDWKSQNIADPVPYFRSALSVISLDYSKAPGLAVVEQVLSTVFPASQGGFSGVLAGTKLQQIYQNLHQALQTILHARDNARGDNLKAITPGFEDMVWTPGLQSAAIVPASAAGNLPPPWPGEHSALEEALGSAFIDYFNGYSVDDITDAFKGYAGTDTHINYALANTFGASFDTTLDGLVNAAPSARDVMNTLARNFGTHLGQSIANNQAVPLKADYDDLKVLIPQN
jgi:hypothetical protein